MIDQNDTQFIKSHYNSGKCDDCRKYGIEPRCFIQVTLKIGDSTNSLWIFAFNKEFLQRERLKEIERSEDNEKHSELITKTDHDNLNTTYTSTELRRRYPKDREGPKNEWKALIKHQADMNDQIVLFEKELSILRARQLGQAYDQQLQAQIEEKEYQLRLKQKDAELMNLKIKQVEMEEHQSRLEKQAFQRLQAEGYEAKIREVQASNAEEKRRNLEYDLAHLVDNRAKIEAERQSQAQKKQDTKTFLIGELDNFHQRKNQEKQDYKHFREEYLQQCQEQNLRQMVKEENYRNFYKLTAENQKQKAQIHKDKVLPDQQRREQHLLDSIDRGVEEVQRRNEDKLRFERALKEESKQHMLRTLDMQVNAKKHRQGMEQQEKLMEGQLKREEYQKYLEETGKVKKAQQQTYRNLLDKQKQENEEIHRVNKMNRDEKKLNFDDLQAYKGIQPTIHALIPGMVHTKHDFHGSPALKPLLNMNHFADTQRSITTIYRPAGLGGPTYTPQKQVNPVSTKGLSIGHDPTIQPYNAGNNVYTTESDQQSQIKGSVSMRNLNPEVLNGTGRLFPPSPGIEDKKATLAEIHSLSTKGGHNPIYNPVPFNIQNPYILKQLHNANRNKANYLASVASNNLINASSS